MNTTTTLGGRTVHLAAAPNLTPAAARATQRARSPHTFRAYLRHIAAFDRFCQVNALDAWQVATVAEWLAVLGETGARAPTIAQAESALRRAWKVAEWNPRHDARWQPVRDVLRGALKATAERGDRTENAPALRLADLAAACRALSRSPSLRDVRDRAILLVAWFACLRQSELCALNAGDVMERPEGLIVTIRSSKASPTEPEQITIPRGHDPATDPAAAWQTWRQAAPRDLIEPDDAPAFTPIDHGTCRPGRFRSGHAVTRLLRRALALADVTDPHSYSAHSLRAGLATELAEVGTPIPQIANAGRWTGYQTVLGYARRARRWVDSPLHSLRY